MRTATMGARPALLAASTAVAVATLIAGGLDLLPTSADQPAKAAPAAPSGDASVAEVQARPAPGRATLTALLGTDLRWGAKVPVPFGCAVATPVISAEAGAVTAHVFGAGLGRAAMDQLARCGTPTTVNGADAVTIKLEGGRLTGWTRGDVLLTLVTTSVPGQGATDLDTALVAALADCADLAPTSADATRNPTQAGYAPFTRDLTVAIPVVAGAPDLGTGPATVPAPEPRRTTLPAGLAGPLLPDSVTPPVAPSWPGPQRLTQAVVVPVDDVTGPGCGWAFTGSVAPAVDTEAIGAATAAATVAAKSSLTTTQTAWLTAATAYPAALEAYTAELTAWTAYVDQVTTALASWKTQAVLVAAHEAAIAQVDTETTARNAFLAAQDSARQTYTAQVAACVAPLVPVPDPTSSPVSNPAPTPTVTAPAAPRTGCPAVRPGVLDQAPPVVSPPPPAPALWGPGA